MMLVDEKNHTQGVEWADYGHEHDGELNWLWLLGGHAEPTAVVHVSELIAVSSRVLPRPSMVSLSSHLRIGL